MTHPSIKIHGTLLSSFVKSSWQTNQPSNKLSGLETYLLQVTSTAPVSRSINPTQDCFVLIVEIRKKKGKVVQFVYLSENIVHKSENKMSLDLHHLMASSQIPPTNPPTDRGGNTTQHSECAKTNQHIWTHANNNGKLFCTLWNLCISHHWIFRNTDLYNTLTLN